MRSWLKYFALILIVTSYSAFQAVTYYKEQKTERSLINNKLEYNLKNLEAHPLNISIGEYDEKYGTTLRLYGKPQAAIKPNAYMLHPKSKKHDKLNTCITQIQCTQQELIAVTKQLMKANNEEPFWSLNAIMKCFVLPLFAIIVGAWLIKKLKI